MKANEAILTPFWRGNQDIQSVSITAPGILGPVKRAIMTVVSDFNTAEIFVAHRMLPIHGAN